MDSDRLILRDRVFAALCCAPLTIALLIPFVAWMAGLSSSREGKWFPFLGGASLGLVLCLIGLMRLRRVAGRRRIVLWLSIAAAVSPLALIAIPIAAMWGVALIDRLLNG